MLRNYWMTIWRNLLKNKVFSLINILGLAIGLTCCLLILLYIKDEVSFDRFHEKIGQLYQVTCDRLSSKEDDKHFAIAAMVQGPAFKKDIPEVEEYVRVDRQPMVVREGSSTFDETATWVDRNFFSVFSFPLRTGGAEAALADLHSVVLTEETAIKYFGTREAMGKTLEVEIDGKFEPFVVSAIARRPPENSSIKFTMLLPFSNLERRHPDNGWMWVSYPTYLVLHPGADTRALSAKMNQVFLSRAKDELDENRLMGYTDRFIWGVQPFVGMHLNKNYEGMPEASDPVYSYILSGIAIFILLIACINFVNLSISQSLRRSREIGIRKVVGGLRRQLLWQFLGESYVVCALAFLLALGLTVVLLPLFNELANKRLSLSYLFDWKLIGVYTGLFLVTGFAAGIYPSMLLSGMKAADVLYGHNKGGGRHYLARVLVVIQFSIGNFLIIATFFIYSQFRFLTRKDLGYNDKGLVVVTVSKAVGDRAFAQVMRTEFAGLAGVAGVSCHNVGKFGGPTKANNREFQAVYEHVDEHYLTVLQVPVVAGRNFSRDYPADSMNSVVVNESFVKAAGWSDPIGKSIDYMNFPGWGDRKITVVGVVRDYNFQSLKEKIQPQVFTLESVLPLGQFLVKLKPEHIPQTLQALEKTYHGFVPFHPFEYAFKEELNLRNYESEAQWKKIIGFGAGLAIFVSCIGLFGLVSLSIYRRTKEIGIRKVLGASAVSISGLLCRDFARLVLIAFLIAVPAAWYATFHWLQNFAYKIAITWQLFLMAGVLTLLIAMATISFHTIRAALANPARSLRTE